MSPTRISAFNAVLATSAAAVVIIGASTMPATADSLPAPGCTTDCIATFDTVGNGNFDVPANITELSVTIAGGAGAPPAHSIPNDSDAVGGTGGASTIDLGTQWAGESLYFDVGGEGGATSLQAAGHSVIAIAGGGGQGGYAGRFDLPDQINATFPGGAGASPTVAGATNGQDATAFSSDPANGLGGTIVGGAGGTGDVNGTAGGNFTAVFDTSITAALGGAGGSTTVNDVEFAAGRGGDGVTGGGGGGIVQFEVDENPLDFAAPGGGGAAFLAIGLSGVAGDPNTSTGHVIFTYSLAVPTALPATGSDLGGLAIWVALGLLAIGGIAIVAVHRRRSA